MAAVVTLRLAAMQGVLLLLLSCFVPITRGSCKDHNFCNGHGKCSPHKSVCDCYEGWGAASDITLYRAPDCSAKTCPPGKAFGDLPSNTDIAHALSECSNQGLCDRTTGTCNCLPSFSGANCEQMKLCPNDCSGHGQCLAMYQLAWKDNALPLSDNTVYNKSSSTLAWDATVIYQCLCDSAWAVGLKFNETQTPEWFGLDCSLRHCPSGDDPMTTSVNETDCYNITAATSNALNQTRGETGNLCQVDCSNRGICDYTSGVCTCFNGYYGHNCGISDALANEAAMKAKRDTGSARVVRGVDTGGLQYSFE